MNSAASWYYIFFLLSLWTLLLQKFQCFLNYSVNRWKYLVMLDNPYVYYLHYFLLVCSSFLLSVPAFPPLLLFCHTLVLQIKSMAGSSSPPASPIPFASNQIALEHLQCTLTCNDSLGISISTPQNGYQTFPENKYDNGFQKACSLT